ncbi:MAG TPA: flagellar basal body rod protein FlgB [Syntrophomonadaceae bacterium]|nr:flagellar basal body rod protein FlgB [Syntrophomonadaceae bacterium]HOQ08708.1 flagellar basal body rod protein FlgB [Syntrophomonadaceae bacterium]HPU47872.1 flagellar basal body rod protein FlgB [Syntrophomonadaceae bacterium]
MFDKILQSPTHQLLSYAMDGAALRNRVIADNIANVDTPNFKRSEVLFEDQLRQLLQEPRKTTPLKVTNPRHIQVARKPASFSPEIYQVDDLSYRNDKNNVDIDTEIAKMSKNSIYYDALSTSLTQEIRLLRLAITGRS